MLRSRGAGGALSADAARGRRQILSGRILLVGGTGFLGSFVTARLAPRNPVVLARPTSDVSVLPRDVEVIRGDLAEKIPLEGVSTLVYCASMGFGHVPPLIHQLESAGVQRAVFVSTTAIFTSLPSTSRQVRLDAESVVTQSSLTWTILRPTMIYGTARDRNVSRLLRFLKRWPVFPLCGNALWQPVHVEDVADAVVAALDCPTAIHRTYNVPGDAPIHFAELVRTAAGAVGRQVMLIPVPISAAIVAARLTRIVTAEQIRRLAEDKAFEHGAASRDFGFTPRSFADGVRLEALSMGLGRT